jgi:hypothetical protein
LSRNISSRNVDELLGAATDLARSQPTLFIGGAIAVRGRISAALARAFRRLSD